MKKVLLLAVLLVSYSNIFAFLTQGNWRWRKDDGSETTATWLANENAAPTITSIDSTLRLRIEVYNTQTNDIALTDTLQYTTDTAHGPWIDITTTAGLNAFMLAGTSLYVVDSEPTTSQLAGASASAFLPGLVHISHEVLYDSVPSDMRTEYEWGIRPTTNLQPNTTYYFQHWGSTAQKKKTTPYPSLRTAGVLAVRFLNFTVAAEDKKVKLQWTTTSEQSSDRFDVERSSDGRAWNVIGSTKGNGTTTGAHTYTVYDNSPLKGMNFYRINQYDMNGKSGISEIKSLKMLLDNSSLLAVFPNPAKSNINFNLPRFNGGDLMVTLSASNGKTVHTETVRVAQQGVTYTLHLNKQLNPGMYILHVKGPDISQSTKVIVQ